jgi:biotin operon repressor
MEEIYNGNGVFIPYEILNNRELTPTEKILYAEIYYLDRPDTHCFASNEFLADFLGISESGVKKCLTHLRQLGYIETVSFDGRNRVLATTVKWTNQVDTPVSSRQTQNALAEGYKNESLLLNKNKIKNNIKSTGAGASSKKHSQVYKQKQTLSDDLESGKDIAEQKKAEKKSPKDKFRDECLDIIDDEYSEKNYSYTVKDLLVEYFEFVSAVPDNKDNLCKRVKNTKMWKNKLVRLDELVKDGYDPIDIIQQSLDKKQYVFYPLQSAQKVSKGKETLSDRLVGTDLEDAKRRYQEAIDNGEEFF